MVRSTQPVHPQCQRASGMQPLNNAEVSGLSRFEYCTCRLTMSLPTGNHDEQLSDPRCVGGDPSCAYTRKQQNHISEGESNASAGVHLGREIGSIQARLHSSENHPNRKNEEPRRVDDSSHESLAKNPDFIH